MAKKKEESLTKRMATLINRVGEKPPPGMDVVKSALVPCLSLAEALEDGATIRDAEAKAEALQQEVVNLQSELQSLKTEVESLRVERQKQKEEERKKELPDVQFKILKRLPSENGGIPWTLPEISYMAQIPVDEAEIHIDRLERARLIKKTWGHSAHVWYRTIAGSELVLAKRLAGEEQKRPKRYKHAELRKDAHEALLLIARSEEGIKEFEVTARCGPNAYMTLGALHNESFVNHDVEIRGTYRHVTWTLAGKGAEYLEERGLL